MKYKIFITLSIIFALVISVNAQTESEGLKAATRIAISRTKAELRQKVVFGEELEYVSKYFFAAPVDTNLLRKTSITGKSCQNGTTEPLSVMDSTDGFFISKEFKTTAYLYQACDRKLDYLYEGIIILRRSRIAKRTTRMIFSFILPMIGALPSSCGRCPTSTTTRSRSSPSRRSIPVPTVLKFR